MLIPDHTQERHNFFQVMLVDRLLDGPRRIVMFGNEGDVALCTDELARHLQAQAHLDMGQHQRHCAHQVNRAFGKRDVPHEQDTDFPPVVFWQPTASWIDSVNAIGGDVEFLRRHELAKLPLETFTANQESIRPTKNEARVCTKPGRLTAVEFIERSAVYLEDNASHKRAAHPEQHGVAKETGAVLTQREIGQVRAQPPAHAPHLTQVPQVVTYVDKSQAPAFFVGDRFLHVAKRERKSLLHER